jgi:hypothetical protein
MEALGEMMDRGGTSASVPLRRKTTTGSAACCALTQNGHAVAPPSAAKNFRRPMWLAMVTLRVGVIHAMER